MSRLRDSARDMTVTVTFFADLRRFLLGAGRPQRTGRLGATVADQPTPSGIRQDRPHRCRGQRAARDTPLHGGAEVMLLSPMAEGDARAAP
jgi:hypothetical protein